MAEALVLIKRYKADVPGRVKCYFCPALFSQHPDWIGRVTWIGGWGARSAAMPVVFLTGRAGLPAGRASGHASPAGSSRPPGRRVPDPFGRGAAMR